MAATLFVNSLLSYLMLFLVIVVVAGVAVFAGITLAKKKNASSSEAVTEANTK